MSRRIVLLLVAVVVTSLALEGHGLAEAPFENGSAEADIVAGVSSGNGHRSMFSDEATASQDGLAMSPPGRARDPRSIVAHGHLGPLAVGAAGQPSPPLMGASGAHLSQEPDVGFYGASSLSNVENSGDPPDGAVAAGPAHVVEAVNTSLSVFTRSGVKLSEVSFGAFFRLGASDLSDPRVLYDERTGRWVALILSEYGTASTLNIALSSSGDPLGAYCKYHFEINLRNGVYEPLSGDFPSLGVDDSGFTVSMPRFSTTTNTYVDTKLYLIPRQTLITCPTSTFVEVWHVTARFPDLQPYSVIAPAIVFGSPGVQYLVATQAQGGNYVAIMQLAGQSTSNPVLSTLALVPVPYYARPPATPQPGSSLLLDTGDARVVSPPVYRDGSLWFAHGAMAPSGRAGVVAYEVQPASRQVAHRSFLWFLDGAYFQPAVMVDAARNVTMLMGTAGTGEGGAPLYPSGAYTTKSPNDPDYARPRVFTRSTQPHVVPNSRRPGTTRWGDYHGIALDPDGRRVWLESETSIGVGMWSTVIVSLPPAPAVATSRYAVTTAAVGAQLFAGASVSVAAQLQSAAGTALATAGRIVSWSASGPKGTFAPATVMTDSRGVASTTFRTSSVAGTYTITATDESGATGTSAAFTTAERPPTALLYFPNVTKRLGGLNGWTTPFYIQNSGLVPTDLSVTFYRFADGSLVTERVVSALPPGASLVDDVLSDTDLPNDTQFSVVVKSYGATIVGVVNQLQGSGASLQALTYSGTSLGATRLYLPNVTRRFYGYDVPLIIQNLGTLVASVSVRFVSFDGTRSLTVPISVQPGRSVVVDPSATAGLIDGTQYAVTVTSSQPVSVVANAHNEAGAPVAFSHNALATGSAVLYAPYAVKSGPDGRFSPIVVQNIGSLPTDVTLDFVPMTAGAMRQSFILRQIPPGVAQAFDPRFTFGTTVPCTSASATCLGPGEYALTIRGITPLAALVLPVSNVTADAYVVPTAPSQRQFLPIVSRANQGWNSPIAIFSQTPGSATVRWYRTSDRSLAAITNVALGSANSVWIDPRNVAGLADNATYSVVIDASAPVTSIVYQLYPAGDGAMIYAGFNPEP